MEVSMCFYGFGRCSIQCPAGPTPRQIAQITAFFKQNIESFKLNTTTTLFFQMFKRKSIPSDIRVWVVYQFHDNLSKHHEAEEKKS